MIKIRLDPTLLAAIKFGRFIPMNISQKYVVTTLLVDKLRHFESKPAQYISAPSNIAQHVLGCGRFFITPSWIQLQV